jgi:hypothetical protein
MADTGGMPPPQFIRLVGTPSEEAFGSPKVYQILLEGVLTPTGDLTVTPVPDQTASAGNWWGPILQAALGKVIGDLATNALKAVPLDDIRAALADKLQGLTPEQATEFLTRVIKEYLDKN